jgi:hypothetical protein
MSKCKADTPASSTPLISCSRCAKSLANSDGSTAGLAARSRAFNSSRPNRLAIQRPEGEGYAATKTSGQCPTAIHHLRFASRTTLVDASERTPEKTSGSHDRLSAKSVAHSEAPDTPGAIRRYTQYRNRPGPDWATSRKTLQGGALCKGRPNLSLLAGLRRLEHDAVLRRTYG